MENSLCVIWIHYGFADRRIQVHKYLIDFSKYVKNLFETFQTQ